MAYVGIKLLHSQQINNNQNSTILEQNFLYFGAANATFIVVQTLFFCSPTFDELPKAVYELILTLNFAFTPVLYLMFQQKLRKDFWLMITCRQYKNAQVIPR